jgi:hypothetical protein
MLGYFNIKEKIMITETAGKMIVLHEKLLESLEAERQRSYPNIPHEIFISLGNFLFFMGNCS